MESAIKLKPEYIKLIQSNPALHGAIAQKVNKSLKTIERWCDSNDDRLTMLSVLFISAALAFRFTLERNKTSTDTYSAYHIYCAMW